MIIIKIRNNKGSFLVLIIAFAMLVTILGVFTIDLISTLLNKQLLNNRAQMLALQVGAIFNAGDRAGRINHLVVGSRELIYRSRQKLNMTGQVPFDHLRPLAEQLLDQARNGAVLLEQERKRLIMTRLSETKLLLTRNQSNSNNDSSVATGSPDQFVDQANVGTYNEYASEVSSSLVEPELKKYDLKHHYIDKSTGCYLGQIDSKLPDDDEDLSFKLCKLPPLTHGCSLRNPADYKQYAVVILNQRTVLPINCDQMPSVISLKLCGNYKTMFSGQTYTLDAISTATTSGPAFR
jgi:hypothetical protein